MLLTALLLLIVTPALAAPFEAVVRAPDEPGSDPGANSSAPNTTTGDGGSGAGSGGSGGAPAVLLSADTRAYIDKALKRWGVPGAAIVAIAGPQFTKKTGDAGWLTEFYNYGVANEAGDKVTEDTPFAIASNTKLFTALSVGTVLGEKNLTWSTKVKDILPEWQLMDPYASDHVDIVDLVAMRSGLPGHPFAKSGFGGYNDAEVVANLRNLPLSTEIRQVYQYNNLHYATLAHIVTTLSGTPYVDWLGQHVLGPLNMTASTFDYTNVKTESFLRTGVNLTQCGRSPDLDHLDPGCFGSINSTGWWNPRPYNKGAGAGEGGLISTTRDLAKWFRELLMPRVLSPDVLNAAATPITVSGPAGMGLGIQAYGAGQVMTSVAGQSVIMHAGTLPGQLSLFVRMPELGLAMGIITNEDMYSGLFLQQAIALRIASDLLGVPPIDLEQEAANQIKLAVLLPPVSPPPSPAPVPSGSEPGGTYGHPGYGTFTLQPMVVGPDSPIESGITAGLARLGLRTTDVLYAKIEKGPQTHITLSHWDGAGFNLTAFSVTERNGKIIVPDAGGSYMAIATPEGIGMFGNFWGAGAGAPMRAPSTENMQQAAEVFFSKA
ncbi:beta-lactamase/transpeptidase-like protein [Cutaneotrichosporon oleaginosum]|uniref:Beta-lactamase/transpeptidase-like protein n=1 Tax=Cutaneotrichosporon oleaginosum TaxID=879819 RepID=A0A0J0XRH9_9TREE|nr:beta-lactamase/transpeptidase-like protein [Cutaneotrichosporon oleaginosum]KLT43700.1 beta-lactamase/transpeptidase-like protein [Cutaneotrichosporon oleaginosum]TXT05118.1 hypothetical protein COLE_06438 [Cutaneotrichosporon oleaginosum]